MREHGGADVRMTIRTDGASDPLRYNAPTAPEIAVIMPGDGYNEQEASRPARADWGLAAHHRDTPRLRPPALCAPIPSR